MAEGFRSITLVIFRTFAAAVMTSDPATDTPSVKQYFSVSTSS